MFYSQFILAKKGPLGTIWIAAHLERKLRKNQVSDTDIGVSVDSILFPEMPIALRLSSHLLLGVVRIYSKKVSYLFDDCSEALLKVKNAFRANAVDLPPEDSTAPYHAITLPETFDLDDFELPDNENLQGSFVDHHVGARDQITLQDTMEGVVYSTSEFGRDERFGDGEASHLDLNEELVVEKAATETAGTASAGDNTLNSNVDPQAKTPIKDGENEDALSDDDGVDQMEDSDAYDDGDADYVPDEYAEGPSTLGLWEEPNLPKVQETPTCIDVVESENASQMLTGYVPHQQEKSTLMEVMPMNDFANVDVGHEGVKDVIYEHAMDKEHGVRSVSDTRENWVKVQGNLENAFHPTSQLVSHSETLNEHENNAEPVQLTNVVSLHSLQTREKPSNFFGGEGSHATNTFDLNLQEIHFTQPGHDEDQVASNLYNNVNQGGNTNIYTSHFAAPERLLGVQERFSDVNQGVNTSIYTSPFHASPERLLPVQERFSDATQQDKTNVYTSDFSAVQKRFSDVNQGNNTNMYTSDFHAAKRWPVVQERFSDVTQQDKTNVYTSDNSSVQKRFSDATQGNNMNMYTSDFHAAKRLPVVQERFSDATQGNNTNIYTSDFRAAKRLPVVQERFSDATQGNNTNTYTSDIHAAKRLPVVQERFSDATQGNNTNIYTSDIHAAKRLPVVQEKLPDVTQVDNTHCYTSQITAPERLLGVQERFPVVTQGNNTNTYTSHFPAAERLLAVQERFSDAVLRQNTPVHENIARGDGGHFASDMHTGNKRSFSESPLMTQSINFGDPSGLLTTKTTAQSVPNNDDMLSSILVGRSSVMQVQPTPPPKRRRQSLPKPPKTGVPKRKVPMDDSTVLHGDMIRQQLTDTSDIRRPRKKVSCSWLELSLIHKQLWEDAIFHEALITGVSIKLASLHNRSYDLRKIRVSRLEASSGAPALKPISQIDENVENVPEESLHQANKDVWIENNATHPNYNGSQEQTNAISEVREPISSEPATIDTDAPLQSIQSDEKTDLPSVAMDSSIDINSKYIDTKNDEIKIDIASPENISETKDEVLVVGPEIVTIDQEVEEVGKNEEETLKPEAECNENKLVPEGSFGKELEADTDNVTEVASCSKDVLLDDKENSGHQDSMGNMEDDYADNRDDDDELEYSEVQNNTDFLNFDDEDDNDAGEADEDLSDTEAKRLIDNSGWSARTKAVGKYLQVMFDKEGEHGRMALRMNSLLTGKTRKEASRMFFETLVLKTKDYIHVEQSDPFENIDILPCSKLLKSDF